MKNIFNIAIAAIALMSILLSFNSCERELSDDADLAGFPKNGEVFIDGFSSGLEYLPFGDSYFEAFSVDDEVKKEGTASMRFDVPNEGETNGSYAGAIFPDYGGRDLSDFDALTFWAKASKSASINEIGFGQDFQENQYKVTHYGLQLTTNWRHYTIAIPDPSVLTQEKGLFWFSEGPEDGQGYSFWIDELQFETTGTVAQPRPLIAGGQDLTLETFIGVTNTVTPLQQTVNLGDGMDQTVSLTPAYFEFVSSEPSVATVDSLGIITAVSSGTAVITATLNGVEAAGSYNVVVSGAFVGAPEPMQEPGEVISIFSDSYTNIPVDYYNGFWEPFQTTLGGANMNINGDNVISYNNLNFVGIQFATDAPTVDASAMTHFHVDVQAREVIEPGDFLIVRIVDAGADNTLGNADDSSGEITIDANSLVQGEWTSIDVPLSEFETLANRSNLAQIVFVTEATISSIFVDNIYMYGAEGSGMDAPTAAASEPIHDSSDVISVYSDAYDDIEGSDFFPNWGQATMASEVTVAGDNALLYSGLNYQGLQLGVGTDVSSMAFLHLDYWTANSTALNVFLISGDEVEVAQALQVPGSDWMSVDIPLEDFSPVDLTNIIQLKFDGSGDVYLDNIYFHGQAESSGPASAAPMPVEDPANVISVYSDHYDDIMGSDYNPNWGQLTLVTEEQIAGDNTLLYSGLNYQGLALGMNTDVNTMEFLHLDYWTSNATTLSVFLISGDAAEVAVPLSVPTSGWASVDIALGEFAPVNLSDIIQFKFEGDGDVYIDNLFFYGEGSSTMQPTQPAPTPAQDPTNVISVYSDQYDDIMGSDYNPNWGQVTVVSEEQIAGDNTLLYAGLNYQGLALGMNTDVSSKEFLHLDYWTNNSTTLNIFLISGDAVEVPVSLSVPTAGWASVDIALSDFAPVDLTDIIQFKFDGDGDIYLDNLYFYSEGGGGGVSLPLSFEDGFNPMIAFDGGASCAVVDNPDSNGNSSAKVLEFNKVVGAAWYSGVVFDENLNGDPLIDLSNGTVFTLKFWSPKAGINVRFQLEGGTAPAYESFVVVDEVNQWVDLVFDFTGVALESDTYPRFAFFPDFDTGNQNPVEEGVIYYIDDISQQ